MSDGMPVEQAAAEMFTLRDRETVRLRLRDLSVDGLAEPLRILSTSTPRRRSTA